jgi:hypothetical protein
MAGVSPMHGRTRHPARDAALLWCIADAGSCRQHHVLLQDPVSAAHREGRCAAHGMTG